MISSQRRKACSHDLKINFFTIRICLAYRRYALKHDNDFAGVGIKKNDHLFHKELFSLAGHGRSWDLMQNQYIHTIRFHMLDFFNSKPVFSQSLDEHKKIVQYIEEGNIEELKNIINIHHDCNLRTSDTLKEKYPYLLQITYQALEKLKTNQTASSLDVEKQSPIEIFKEFYEKMKGEAMSQESEEIIQQLLEEVSEDDAH